MTMLVRANALVSILRSRRENAADVMQDINSLKEQIRSSEQQFDTQKPLISLIDNLLKQSTPHGVQNSELAARQVSSTPSLAHYSIVIDYYTDAVHQELYPV